jgi:hypothetical protein
VTTLLSPSAKLVKIEIAAGAAGHVIDETTRVVPGDDLLEVFQRQRHVDIRIAIDRHADDEVVARVISDAFDNLPRETHAVLEAAAPAIVAAVRPGRPELVDERVIGGEQLNAVETRLLGAAGRLGESVDHLVDLRLAHPMAAVGVVIGGQARWRPGGLIGVVEIAVLPHMVDLMNHHRVVLVTGVGDAAEVRNHAVVAVAEVAAGQDTGGVGRDGLTDDHRGAATGPLCVVAEVALTGQAVLGHVGGVSAEVEPVLQCLVAQAQGVEQVGKRRRHGGAPGAARASHSSVGGRLPVGARRRSFLHSRDVRGKRCN